MKELDYPPNFWNIVYWGVLDFSKKIWGLGAPSIYGALDPQNASNKAFRRVPGPIGGGALRPQIFFKESRTSE